MKQMTKLETHKIRKFFIGVSIGLFLPMLVAWVVCSLIKPFPYNENVTIIVSCLGVILFGLVLWIFFKFFRDCVKKN